MANDAMTLADELEAISIETCGSQLAMVSVFFEQRYRILTALRTSASPTGDVWELVERLRGLADEHFEMLGDIHEPLTEAADAITALHARVQELEAKWVELPGVE